MSPKQHHLLQNTVCVLQGAIIIILANIYSKLDLLIEGSIIPSSVISYQTLQEMMRITSSTSEHSLSYFYSLLQQ